MFFKLEKGDIGQLTNKKLLLFGAGSRGSYFLEELNKIGAEVIGFIDNDKTKWGGNTIDGYMVYSPEYALKFFNAKVIVTSIYFEAIKQQLLDMGCKDFDIVHMGAAADKLSQNEFIVKFLSKDDSNEFIYRKLLDNEPFFAGRIGSNELECMSEYYYVLNREKGGTSSYHDNLKLVMKRGAGFYPTEDSYLDKMVQIYTRGFQDMDFIWNMWLSRFENMLYMRFYNIRQNIGKYKDTAFPYDIEKPWTEALHGRKVLVIHPFEQSIRQNYKNRDNLHKNKMLLPEFELITFKPVQSIADEMPGFSNWFEALESMKERISNIDFDIALIAAGAYGLPLAEYCKSIGKKALHIGGWLQLYFGIKGKAFDKLNLYNNYWTSPRKEEHPKGYKKVEAGRYW